VSNPNPAHGSAGLAIAASHVPDNVSLPDLETLLANLSAHGGSAPHASPEDLNPTLPPTSEAGDHAGQGIETAMTHVPDQVTLPDLVSLTGHDFFFHG
jgi:hypothetical protein